MHITRDELEALAETVTQSVLIKLATMHVREDPCRCHEIPAGVCPDRIRDLVDGGAERLGFHAQVQHQNRGLAPLIDHTFLAPDADEARIRVLCEEAVRHGFATVCVNPVWVRLASSLLSGTPTGVSTVVAFPLGANAPDVKIYETRRAVFDGADEIDMVINIGALKSRDYKLVEEDILGVVCCCRESATVSKVIIETGLLDQEEKIKACALAAAAGADFVKTSTGFGPGGATVEDVRLMRRVVGERMGVKAAGGVRDAATASRMVEAGATRIGASAGVRIVSESGTSGKQKESV